MPETAFRSLNPTRICLVLIGCYVFMLVAMFGRDGGRSESGDGSRGLSESGGRDQRAGNLAQPRDEQRQQVVLELHQQEARRARGTREEALKREEREKKHLEGKEKF